jgi:alpha-amylase/alpha-mannosidase (GH57 family)
MQPFVLHAHFYQPERLNPWTGALDPEPSADPDRDWNERILRECYRPNAAARIYGPSGRVERIVNNYERLSFNFGPTLMSWMERRHPRTYARIVDGDWRSVVRTGHGNALAQAYNHMILPLANDRDRATQLHWGLADFRHRFGREAEGLWLPETAADRATIDALIEAGVTFTVLAPYQAARVRADGAGPWQDLAAGAHDLDTGRPYRHLHSDGSGREIAVFFYDGGLAQGLAFDRATADTAVLIERLRTAAAARGGALVHAALDGETFGHHHPFAELGLAYALFEAAEARGLRPTNYSAYLAEHPPTDEVEVVGGEGTAWSCSHGVGRWYRDCGCSTDGRPGWNQAWRTPLRRALDLVRDAAVEAFETLGGELLKQPWAARDDYVHVRLGEWTPATFIERHALHHLDGEQRVNLWSLLESQRHAMIMYTSCGWFFADVSGIETVYVLRSASRVLGLLDEVGAGPSLLPDVLDLLAEARSNKPGLGSGADVWRGQVDPARVTPARVAAHTALRTLVRPRVHNGVHHGIHNGASARTASTTRDAAGHTVLLRRHRSETSGRLSLATARMTVTALATGRTRDYVVGAVHLGGLDFHGVVAPYQGDEAFDRTAGALWAAFPTAPVVRLLRMLGDLAPDGDGEELSLDDVLPEGRQEVVGAVFGDLRERFREQYARLYLDHRRILEMLAEAGCDLPPELRAAAELTLSAQLVDQLDAAVAHGDGPEGFGPIRDTLLLARSRGYRLALEPVERALSAAITEAVATTVRSLHADDVHAVERWVGVARELGVSPDLVRAQEHAYEAAVKARSGRLRADQSAVARRLGTLLGLSPVAWTPRPRP